MKKSFKYIFAAFAACVFSVSAFALADGEPDYSAIKAKKTAKVNGDGSVTITLETFVTGEVSYTAKRKPINAVLVLDVSGSMAKEMGEASYEVNTRINNFNNYNSSSSLYSAVKDYTCFIKVGERYFAVAWEGGRTDGHAYYSDGLSTVAITSTNFKNFTYYKQTINSTGRQTRLSALKSSCQTFIDLLQKDAIDNGVSHKVSIVTFSSDANTVVDLSKGKLSTQAGSKNTTLSNAITNLKTGGDTYHGKGLQNAETELTGDSSDANAKKMVLMFTDGNPAPSGTDFFSSVIADEAVEAAHTLKGNSVDLYCVNVFPGSDALMHRYMNLISSNYPDATSLSQSGEYYDKKSKDVYTVLDPFYKFASNTESLKEIFASIIEQVIDKAGADIDLKPSEVKLQDAISTSFMLPEGATKDDIKLYEAKCTGLSQGVYYFDDVNRTPCSAAKVEIDPNDAKKFTVVDYDFSKNWCGPVTRPGQDTYYVGNKLIVEFIVVPDPSNDGGLFTTNDQSQSGVYVKIADTWQNKSEYVVQPGMVFVPSVALVVEKSGLKENESAIFDITRPGMSPIRVVVTATERDANWTAENPTFSGSATVKVDAYGSDVRAPYTYTVTELSAWSWAYETPDAKSQVLYTAKFNSDGLVTDVDLSNAKFSFTTGLDASNGVKHGEDATADNVFEK